MEEKSVNPVAIGIGAVLVIVALMIIFGGFFMVQPGEIGFLVRYGNIQEKTYTEGLYFKTPVVENAIVMSIKDKKVEVIAKAASKDLQDVSAIIALNYSINPEAVKALYRQVGTQGKIEDVLVAPAIQEAVKSATAQFNASELITERSEVRAEMMTNLKNKLEPRGVMVNELNIVNFDFSASFNEAIEAKVRAEQDALAEKNNLEKVKFQQQQQIEISKAEAEKIRIQAEAITSQGGAEFVKLQRISKRDGQLPTMMLGGGEQLLLNISQ